MLACRALIASSLRQVLAVDLNCPVRVEMKEQPGLVCAGRLLAAAVKRIKASKVDIVILWVFADALKVRSDGIVVPEVIETHANA